MRRLSSANIKATGEWSPTRKKPRGRPKNEMARWSEVRFGEVGNGKWTNVRS